jgi:hypothetical protein
MVACALGCAVATMDGTWQGPVPLAGAKDCRIKLQGQGVVDLTCGGSPGYAGKGTWHLRGRTLDMELTWLASSGEIVRGTLPRWILRTEPHGNKCRVVDTATQIGYEWERAKL